tara:strand:- start:1031 stop:1231 length:201 start_codon:yes stop_codon:yes gene_type:complete
MERIGEIRIYTANDLKRVQPVYRTSDQMPDGEQRREALRGLEITARGKDSMLELYDARGNLVYRVS